MPSKIPLTKSILKAAKALKNGALIAMPTETVYGLAADATNEFACQKIFTTKKRPQDNPLIVHIPTATHIKKYAKEVPEIVYQLAKKFWPGPLTIILKDNEILPNVVTAGTGKIALRAPAHPMAQKLLKELRLPIVAPSANKSGKPSPTKPEHIQKDFTVKNISLILDGGQTKIGLESTIIDLSDPKNPLLVRPGAVTLEDLTTYIPNIKILKKHTKKTTVAPGLKYKHYAPNAPLKLFKGLPAHSRLALTRELKNNYTKKITIICTKENATHYLEQLKIIKNITIKIHPLASYLEPEIAASKIFDTLRQCDQQKVDLILCETWSPSGIGQALQNRLEKAAE